MLASVAIAPLNHLLRGESWARKRLQPCAGKTARFCIPPFVDFALIVQPNGEVATAVDAAATDATLTFVPGLLPRLLAHDADAYRNIHISGDNAFAEELLHIGKNLHWDVEQDLSLIMGDILAHRMVQAGDNLLQWHTDTLRNLSQMLAEYWTEEQPLLAKPAYVRKFIDDVSALRNDAEQLEKRVEKLSHRAPL
ncbi:MAG: ubiquinone biosynthesis protein [Nitrosomonadaceae bacterium]|nr:MAG: ubiquinone biosynthesis protein [Nitrosomonadaceae bacterium]